MTFATIIGKCHARAWFRRCALLACDTCAPSFAICGWSQDFAGEWADGSGGSDAARHGRVARGLELCTPCALVMGFRYL